MKEGKGGKRDFSFFDFFLCETGDLEVYVGFVASSERSPSLHFALFLLFGDL